jgi:hypothetical protein
MSSQREVKDSNKGNEQEIRKVIAATISKEEGNEIRRKKSKQEN